MTPKLNMKSGRFRQFRLSWLFACFAAGLIAGKFSATITASSDLEQADSPLTSSESPALLQQDEFDELTRSLQLVASRNSNFSQASPLETLFIHFPFDSNTVIDRLIKAAQQESYQGVSRMP